MTIIDFVCLKLSIRFCSFSLYSQFYEILPLNSSSPFIEFFILAIIFHFRNSFIFFPFFSEELVLLFYGCNLISNL